MLKLTMNCNSVGRFKQLTTAKLGVGETMNYEKLGRGGGRNLQIYLPAYALYMPATRVFGKNTPRDEISRG